MSVSMRPRGRPIARLGAPIGAQLSSTFVATTDGGYPWHDGELLYADDLNAAISATSVSVLELGAKGDGVTDDTLAIQYAMNAYAGKAVVYIPDTGHPYIVSTLTPPSGLSLWLDGTLKLIAGASGSLITFTGQSNVTITGHGVLDGNKPGQAGADPLLGVGGFTGTCTNLRVYGITITNAHYWNVNLTGCSNVRLDGVRIFGGGAANEFAAGCDDCWLINSLIDGTDLGDYAFAFYGGVTNSGAVGNTVRNAGAGTSYTPIGIGILSDGDAGTPTAIQCRNITIAHNIIHDCAGPGISSLHESGGLQSGITIVGNITHGNSKLNGGGIAGADVFIDLSTDVTIADNQLGSNGGTGGTQYTGIFLGPNTSRISVTGNRIYNVGIGPSAPAASNAGVWVDGTVGLYMSGNYIYDDQTVPSMGYSIIGGCGAGSAIVGNFFRQPYNFGPQTDTVMANIINGTWMEGGLSGADSVSVIQADGGHRGILEYQTGYIPRWLAGTDGTAEQDYAITRVDNTGTQKVAASINRLDGSLSVHSFGLNLGDPAQTSDTAITIDAAATTNRLISFQSGGVGRWRFVVNPLESGGNSGSDIQLQACRDDGSILSTALGIKRSTGLLTIVTPPPFSSDAAAAAGGIPVGGIYRNGSALSVRVT